MQSFFSRERFTAKYACLCCCCMKWTYPAIMKGGCCCFLVFHVPSFIRQIQNGCLWTLIIGHIEYSVMTIMTASLLQRKFIKAVFCRKICSISTISLLCFEDETPTITALLGTAEHLTSSLTKSSEI